MIELSAVGISAVQQAGIKVFYEDKEVGSYFADILVENKIVVEAKAGAGEIKRSLKYRFSTT